jgi:hypothetical protein
MFLTKRFSLAMAEQAKNERATRLATLARLAMIFTEGSDGVLATAPVAVAKLP